MRRLFWGLFEVFLRGEITSKSRLTSENKNGTFKAFFCLKGFQRFEQNPEIYNLLEPDLLSGGLLDVVS